MTEESLTRGKSTEALREMAMDSLISLPPEYAHVATVVGEYIRILENALRAYRQ